MVGLSPFDKASIYAPTTPAMRRRLPRDLAPQARRQILAAMVPRGRIEPFANLRQAIMSGVRR